MSVVLSVKRRCSRSDAILGRRKSFTPPPQSALQLLKDPQEFHDESTAEIYQQNANALKQMLEQANFLPPVPVPVPPPGRTPGPQYKFQGIRG